MPLRGSNLQSSREVCLYLLVACWGPTPRCKVLVRWAMLPVSEVTTLRETRRKAGCEGTWISDLVLQAEGYFLDNLPDGEAYRWEPPA